MKHQDCKPNYAKQVLFILDLIGWGLAALFYWRMEWAPRELKILQDQIPKIIEENNTLSKRIEACQSGYGQARVDIDILQAQKENYWMEKR